MILRLNQDESKTFFEIVDSELKCVINEWDSELGRRPSQKRIRDGKHAKSIMDKWSQKQPNIPHTTFVDLEKIDACDLELTDKETAYSKCLLEKNAKECRKELAKYTTPYTGMLLEFDRIASCAENISIRL